jgi:uncharacterized protein (TIGR02231 family)
MRPDWITLKTAAVAWLCMACSAEAQTLPTEVRSDIESVTVYPGVAVVARVVKVPAQARQVVLNCLSTAFDMSALRVHTDPSVQIGAISAIDLPRNEVAACNTSPLDEPISALEQKIAALQAAQSSHGVVLDYLKNIGTSPTPSASLTGLPTALAQMQRSHLEAGLQHARLGREKETLERELKLLLSQRARQQAPESVRQLKLQVSAAKDSTLRLTYPIQGPTWAPAYRATLDTTLARVQMERLAQVTQNSGEDWRDIQLRLSTGSPRSAPQGTAPRPWRIAVRSPDATTPAMLRAPSAPAPAPMARSYTATALEFAVQVSQGEFATEFQVPGKVVVLSGQQRVALSLERQQWPARIFVQTSPQTEAVAWLKAEVPRPEGVWPDGILHLQRDQETVGQSIWRMGERNPMVLPFGRDEQVRVQVRAEPAQTSQTGLISTRQEKRETRHFEIQNMHRTPVELEVLEVRPISTDSRITVQAEFAPPIEPQAASADEGMVVWKKTLPASSSASFTAKYLIAHPQDIRIMESR